MPPNKQWERETDTALHADLDADNPPDVVRAALARLSVELGLSDAANRAWQETQHPRHPAGTGKGGKFAPKGNDLDPDEKRKAFIERYHQERRDRLAEGDDEEGLADSTARLYAGKEKVYEGPTATVYRGMTERHRARDKYVFVTADKAFAAEFGPVTAYRLPSGTTYYPDPERFGEYPIDGVPYSMVVKRSDLESSADNTWQEGDHPRHPAGTGKGGEFAPKVGGGDVETEERTAEQREEDRKAGEDWVNEMRRRHPAARYNSATGHWDKGHLPREADEAYYHFGYRVQQGTGDYEADLAHYNLEMELLGRVRRAAGDDMAALKVLGSQSDWSSAPDSDYLQSQAVAAGADGEMSPLSEAEIRAVRERTAMVREHFRRQYPDGVTVYRGIYGRQATAVDKEVTRIRGERFKAGTAAERADVELEVTTNPASSWTIARSAARDFARGRNITGSQGRSKRKGVVLERHITADDVYLMPRDLGSVSVLRHPEDIGEIVILHRKGRKVKFSSYEGNWSP